jgi:hypothetical protein
MVTGVCPGDAARLQGSAEDVLLRDLDRSSVLHRMGWVDDISRAAIQQPAMTCCWGVAHEKLAGVDDFYIARAAIRQPAVAGW